MSKLSRRSILAAGATGGVVATAAAARAAGMFGNPDLPPQGAVNATAPALSGSPRQTVEAGLLSPEK